jgi:hypothetical protein
MDDSAYLALSKEEAARRAQAKIQACDFAEGERLRALFFREYGISSDSILGNAATEEPPRGRAAEPQQSAMLQAGPVLFWTGLGVTFFGGLVSANPDVGFVVHFLTLLGAAALSFGLLFWVGGAIEQRLIEIRDRLGPKTS